MDFLKKLRMNQDGSFTIEASLLFPMILIMTLTLVFFCLIVFEKVVLHQRAQIIANRSAYVWNNSSKDISTGTFTKYTSDPGSTDGLYWRLSGNQIFSKFHLNFGGGTGEIEIGNKNNTSLIDKKLSRIPKGWMPAGSTGNISFHNNWTGGKIIVNLNEPLRIPDSISKLLRIRHISTRASASISDPVEFVRDTDFLYHNASVLLEKLPSGRSPGSAISIFKRGT